MNEWINEWMNEWMNELMNEWMNKWMNEWMNRWKKTWTDEDLMNKPDWATIGPLLISILKELHNFWIIAVLIMKISIIEKCIFFSLI